jgi:hypothetical protein
MTDVATQIEPIRRPSTAPDRELKVYGIKFLAALPVTVRPLKLGEKYPRIVNTLGLLRGQPTSFRAYFDDLFVDNRGDRQGFPPDIEEELARLKVFFETVVWPNS